MVYTLSSQALTSSERYLQWPVMQITHQMFCQISKDTVFNLPLEHGVFDDETLAGVKKECK
jgi:hypothetical protein